MSGTIKHRRPGDVFDTDDVTEINGFDLDGRLFKVRLPDGSFGEAFISGTEEIRVVEDGPVSERWVAQWLNNQAGGLGAVNTVEWLRRERVTLKGVRDAGGGRAGLVVERPVASRRFQPF
jgi:hypothetical protein